MKSTEQDRNQALALAAVFQAAVLAEEVATRGSVDTGALRALVEGLLTLEPDSFGEVYPEPLSLDGGRRLLRNALEGQQTRAHVRPVGYALALIHLAGKLRKDRSLMSVLRNRLEALQAQRPHFTDITTPEFSHRMAGIYVDTLGTMRFRIKVHGEPQHLSDDNNAARIRAIFLTGVRAAFLWHQSGGRRWHLIFSRKRLLQAVSELA